MNLLKFVLVVSAVLLTFGIVAEKIAYGIYEDQIIACNFDDECVTIDIDDFMDDESIEKLWMQYQYDMDTYDIEDID